MAFSVHSLPFSIFSPRHRLLAPPTFKLPVILLASFPAIPSPPTRTIVLPTAFRSAQLCRRLPSTSMASGAKQTGAAANLDPGILVFENEEELSVSLAKYTSDLSEKFIKERGAFTVVLSGDSLVKSLRKLVEPPYADSIDWGRWHVFWVDEIVVPKAHPYSNYKLAFDGFISKVEIPTGQVYAIDDSLSAEDAADDYETCLKHLVNIGVIQLSPATKFPKFDLMLLGMGPDGHIASLFPGHPLLSENERWVAFMNNSPKQPSQRITFTFPVINSSAYIALVATGASKADAVHRSLGSKKSSSYLLPIQMVKLDDGSLSWFIDKAAASKLQDKAGL